MLQERNKSMAEHSNSNSSGGVKHRRVGEGSILTALGRYHFVREMSKAQRMAHFLDWMCKNGFAYVLIPANLVCKAINGYARKPTMGSEEVQSVQGASSRVRNILRKQYNRSLWVVKGEGMRATVDATDAAGTTLRRTAERAASVHRSLAAERAIIDPNEIKDERLRRWVKSGVDATLKMLETDDRLMKLLPPKDEEEDKDKE